MNNKVTRFRAILLDCYGTVVEDDDALIADICGEIAQVSSMAVTSKEVISYWGRLINEMCLKSHGDAFLSQKEIERISLAEVLVHFDANLDSERICQTLYEYWAHPVIFPESSYVIARCNIPICLLSNIDNAELDSALRHSGLSFDWIVTSEDCKAYKPRPEPFEKALSSLGLPGEEVLHIGDSFNCDVRGAKAQRIPVLWVNRNKRRLPAGYDPPDYVSADLTGMLDILFP